jgi:fatty-acyl-CoA synthase
MTNAQGLGYVLTRRAQLYPHHTALVFNDQSWTYAELDSLTNQAAHALAAGGVCTGDRVAYLGLNNPRFFFTLFAAAKLGAIFVPLNFRLTAEELGFIVKDAGVHTFIFEEVFADTVDKTRETAPCREYVCSVRRDNARSFEDLLSDQRSDTVDAPVQPDDVAWIMYTSGTTGRPKGAMLTHGNILWNNINASLSYDTLSTDATLVVAPLFHIGGLNVTPIGTFMKGGKVVLGEVFEPGMVLELIEKHQINTMFGVPAMFQFISLHPDFEKTDLSSVRIFICGGAPVPESLIELYGKRGITFAQGYGLTETAPFACFVPVEMAQAKIGSAGLPPFFTEVELVDDQDRPVASGERGEICVRGPNVMKGYWNRPDATAEAIRNGWFHTGDVGVADEDGYIYVVDRKKDMIISGGENVYPAEVEEVLYRHPGIKEVAVIGVSDPKWGETVRAIVVAKDGVELTEQEVIAFTDGKLARYKQPKSVVFTDMLPRNPAQKVLKFELREKFGSPSVSPKEAATK